jgi:L-cysteine:1D-myo-inositol 2-amino-2-deoxy-alpha-D-glucopyranoside ligase
MSVTHLGPQFEIHGGGRDLAFPHHEAERLQSEGATGVRPVVGHWVHTGMVRFEDEKMSKSLGNLVMVADLLRRWRPDVVRLALIGHHYRDDLAWTDGLAAEAAARLARWTEAARLRDDALDAPLPDAVAGRREEVLSALANDLDTPGAIRQLDALAGVALGRHADATRRAAARLLHDLATRVLGLRLGALA